MQIRNKHKIFLLILLAGVSAGAFLYLRSHVFSNMGLSINKKIQSLNLSGFNVRYDSLSVDWRGNTIEIFGLLLEKNAYDTTCIYPEFISVGKVRAEGMRLFPLIFHNVLDFSALYLETPRIVLRENSLLKLDSAAQRENEFTLKTDMVHIHDAEFEFTDSVTCKPVTGISGNASLRALEMEFRADRPFRYTAETLVLDSSVVTLPLAFYTLTIDLATVDFTGKTLTVDSIHIKPDFGKLEFGRKKGYETDRFEGIIPFIRVNDFTLSSDDSTSRLSATMAEVQFYLKIFRDKRLPFKKVAKLLPVEMLQSLPYALVIDSLKIIRSYVQYEEFPEEAADAGGIFFDDLYAVFSNVDNREKDGDLRLEARSSLMGQGAIALSAIFPLTADKRSSVKGSLQDFPLPKLNPMLTPSTNIEVESGQMKKLSFAFSYNATQSDGEIELNYEDLKLITYKEEGKKTNEKDGPQKDNFKTFIINTFIFRKNMDESVPEEKRKGTVSFVRDNNRSIFNFWSKSLLSGIKSAYNLDKAAEKKSERDLKREERLVRRQEKKSRKADKKRDRG